MTLIHRAEEALPVSAFTPDPQPGPDSPQKPDPDPRPDPVASSGSSSPFDASRPLSVKDMRDKESYFGPAGLAVGYSRSEWTFDGGTAVTRGVHVDVPFVWNKLSLGLVTPSLTVESDLGFPDVAVTAGAGPGVHFLLPGIFQLYGKFMVDGHAAAIDGEGRTGWTGSAVGGGALGIGATAYLEYRQAVAGSADFREERRTSFGVRLLF